MLRTTTVEGSTLELLRKLQQLPVLSDLRLVGGTALALQLGHRHSIDLDFFGTIEASGLKIAEEMRKNALKVDPKYDTRNIKTLMVNDVKIDIVNYSFAWIEPAIETDGVRMAGLKDIAAMKLEAITNRGTRKDFVDMYFLLQHFSLEQMLVLYGQKYPTGSVFNVVRSLSYFVDAETYPMPKMFASESWQEMKSTIQEAIATL